MTSLSVAPQTLLPVLKRKNRKIRKQRKVIQALALGQKKPRRRITAPPSEKQLAARNRMKAAARKAQEIYRSAAPGTIKWREAIARAWKEV
jgi:hypothetical protein